MDIREEIRMEGRIEGRQEGWQKGRMEGRQEGLRVVVQNMLKERADIAFISKVTGWPIWEIKKFKNGS